MVMSKNNPLLSDLDWAAYIGDKQFFSNGILEFNKIWEDLKKKQYEEFDELKLQEPEFSQKWQSLNEFQEKAFILDTHEINSLNTFLHSHPKITGLNLHGMKIGDTGISLLAENKTLLTLDVSRNEITSKGAEALAKNDHITTLIIDSNPIDNQGAAALITNSKLSRLCMERCDLSQGGWAGELGNNTNLKDLNLSGNNIDDEIVQKIANNKHITSLDLSFNKIKDNGVIALLGMRSLNNLNLKHNPLEGDSSLAIASNLTIQEIKTNVQISHEQTSITQFMTALGYKNVINGCCHGISFMAMQALYIKDGMLSFNKRLHEIYKIVDSAEEQILAQLSKEEGSKIKKKYIENLREEYKDTLSKEEENKIRNKSLTEPPPLLKKFDLILSEKINSQLDDIKKSNPLGRADLLAFCDSAYLHQKTGSLSYLFSESPEKNFNQAKRFIPLATASELEGSIEPIKQITGVYSLKELEIFFSELQETLNNQSLSNPVTILLSSSDHSIMVAYNPYLQNWIYTDPNHLPSVKMEDNQEVAKRILRSLSDTPQTLLSTKIFSHSSEKEIINTQVNKWFEKKNIQDLHKVTPEKLAFTQLHRRTKKPMTWQSLAELDHDTQTIKNIYKHTSFLKRHPRLSAAAITLGVVGLVGATIAVSALSFGVLPAIVGAVAIAAAPMLMSGAGFSILQAKIQDKEKKNLNLIDIFNKSKSSDLISEKIGTSKEKVSVSKEKMHVSMSVIFNKIPIDPKLKLSEQNHLATSPSVGESIKIETKKALLHAWVANCLQADLNRNEATHLLMENEQGTFILRNSSKEGCLALSVKGNGNVYHFQCTKETLEQYKDINAFYQSIRDKNPSLPQLNLIVYDRNKGNMHLRF